MFSNTMRILPALGLMVPALLIGAPLQAEADLITDSTINFEITQGSPIPTGSFIYNDTTLTLTSYLVSWDGITFDFTNLIGVLSKPLLSLQDLQQPGSWSASILQSSGTFGATFNLTYPMRGFNQSVTLSNPVDLTSAAGTFTVTSSTSTTAPEPSALAIMGAALAGLFLFRSWANRRTRQLCPQDPETA